LRGEKTSARDFVPVWNKKETYNKLATEAESLMLRHEPLNYIALYKNTRQQQKRST